MAYVTNIEMNNPTVPTSAPPATIATPPGSGNDKIPKSLGNVMDDLCMRFILNLPDEEYTSFERLFFAVESAHWFYEDFYRENNNLPKLGLKPFANKLLQRTSIILNHNENNTINQLINKFQQYKQEVPTYGAALLNSAMTKVIMVRGWGREGRWNFPKGKLAKKENELECATREVYEEIGYDITTHINENTYYINRVIGEKISRIYVIKDISESFPFQTQTRKEISDIQWIPISALPITRTDCTFFLNGHKAFFAQSSVPPFVNRLRLYIERQKRFLSSSAGITTTTAAAGSNPVITFPTSLLPTSTNLPNNQHQFQHQFQHQHGHYHGPYTTFSSTPVSPSSTARATGSPSVISPTSSRSPTLDVGKRTVSNDEMQYVSNPVPAQGNRKFVETNKVRRPGSVATHSSSSALSPSPPPPKPRKAKKVPKSSERNALLPPQHSTSAFDEESKNRATFGVEAASLTDEERRKYFQQYVVETDSNNVGRASFDETWPVHYFKSTDLSPEERREAELAAKLTKQRNGSKSSSNGTTTNTKKSVQASLQEAVHNQVNAIRTSSLSFQDNTTMVPVPFNKKATKNKVEPVPIKLPGGGGGTNGLKAKKNGKAQTQRVDSQRGVSSNGRSAAISDKKVSTDESIADQIATAKVNPKVKSEVTIFASKGAYGATLVSSIQQIITPMDQFVFDKKSIMMSLRSLEFS